ncbi:MerR family transcriptional regulator [Minwuia sp.]|uniref:MerR family transcriptional regulator n=1 Tax=Minwuia sp. TaxID=2493630 RepID=UPI003A9530B1
MHAIGALAKATGVKVPTIRYYEQIGLLDAPERTDGGQRRYDGTALDRLTFIRHARDLGFSIDDIAALLRLSAHATAPCEDVNALAAANLESVRQRISRLQALETELSRIVASCADGTVKDCQVIRSLSDHGLCRTSH